MDGIALDTLAYSKKLIALGFTQALAEGFAELAQEERQKIRAEIKADLEARDKLDEATRQQLATKGDVADVRLEIEKVRREIEQIRTQGKDIEARLIKWQIGIAVGLGTAMLTGFGILGGVMAKGFNWLGF